MIDEANIKLIKFGEYIYNTIIFFAPRMGDNVPKSSSDLKIAKILKFIDDGHDILIFADESVDSYIRSLTNEFGVDFDEYVIFSNLELLNSGQSLLTLT